MLLAEYDYKTDIAVQRAEALEIGMQKGKLEGKLETARSFKNIGVGLDKIATATGLTKEEIERL